MSTDSTVLISKYLKEYNHIYKEANEIYHEAARRLHLSDSAFEIFYALFDMGDNCLQRDICKSSCLPKQTINSSIRKLQADGYEIVPVSQLLYTENYSIDPNGAQIKN